MADIKISNLGSLTSPASDDLMVIVDDSETLAEKTKKISWANIRAALTGQGAQYTTSGAYYATFPTNSITANARVMLGDTNTVAWFYLNAAPPGWKVQPAGGDAVLAVSGGSGPYNVNGGNVDSLSSWQISGLTMAHTHTGGAHTHDAGSLNVDTYHRHIYGTILGAEAALSRGQYYTDYQGSTTKPVTGQTASGGDVTTSAASTSTVVSNGTWRPHAYVGKLFKLDQA